MSDIASIIKDIGLPTAVAVILVVAVKYMWSRYLDMFERMTEYMAKDTLIKDKLAGTIEDVVAAVDVYKNMSDKISSCSARTGESLGKLDAYIEDQRLERAREDGRREVTAKIVVKNGGHGEE